MKTETVLSKTQILLFRAVLYRSGNYETTVNFCSKLSFFYYWEGKRRDE